MVRNVLRALWYSSVNNNYVQYAKIIRDLSDMKEGQSDTFFNNDEYNVAIRHYSTM